MESSRSTATRIEKALPGGAMEAIPDSVPVDILLREIEALPADRCVLDERRFGAYLVESGEIPEMLNEICRQREIAFREVGEGTGKAIDRDRFDDHYLHIFLWDREGQSVAGAYRLGLTDRILSERGAEGLYCSSLFDFEPEFLDFLNPGIEMGRSFIVPAYQRMMQPLALLWKGMSRFVAENPRYRQLYGPVSISHDYTNISKHQIVEFMEREHRHPTLSKLVRPRNPFDAGPIGGLEAGQISESLCDIKEVSARISDNEPDGKGVPILLKHYLRLNATLLSFNVDPEFSNALDALVLVDLLQMPSTLLKLYFGREGAEQFRSYHAAG